MFGEIYHNRVLELAANIPHAERLRAPDGTAEKVSRVCGSIVRVDVILDKDNRIAEIGIDPKACALGQATSAVLTGNAIGASLGELVAGRDGLRDMLKDGASPPEGRFWELRHLEPVRDYPQRHASTLLAFEAAIAAMEDALETARADAAK